MPKRHGGPRVGSGRPATTASSTTRPVTFRLGAEDYDLLASFLKSYVESGVLAPSTSVGQLAAKIVRFYLLR